MIALIQYGGWTMYRGPKFVLYGDGLVLFQRDIECWPQTYYAARLTQREMGRLADSLKDGWWELDRCCYAAGGSDNVASYILASNNDTKVVGVYGNVTKPEYRSRAPRAFLEVFDRLYGFDDSRAKPWVPTSIRARLYRQEGPVEEKRVVVWPDDWPRPAAVTGRGRYEVQLPGSALPTLTRLFPGVGKEVPVRLGGSIFFVQYRLEVPLEHRLYRAVDHKPCDVDAPTCTKTRPGAE